MGTSSQPSGYHVDKLNSGIVVTSRPRPAHLEVEVQIPRGVSHGEFAEAMLRAPSDSFFQDAFPADDGRDAALVVVFRSDV